MTIALPDLPRGTNVAPGFVAAGGALSSALGGPTQELLRFGDRMRLSVETPKLAPDCAAAWIAALMAARTEGGGVRCKVPQLGAVPGVLASGAAGSVEVGFDASPGGVGGLKPGQWFSFSGGGASYLHMLTRQVSAGVFHVAPRLRATVSGPVEMVEPVIEGLIEGDLAWAIERLRIYGRISLAIVERK